MTESLLPGYADADIKKALLSSGASGTVYALVMPESEAAIQTVVDGFAPSARPDNDKEAHEARVRKWLSRFREPWTQKQDAMHREYFDLWIGWSSPVVKFNPDDFTYRYPTAGASEGIFKLMAEYLAATRDPTINIFHGEYEGFSQFAETLGIRVIRHNRGNLAETIKNIPTNGQFWVSQPSAIDGQVWDGFDKFAADLSQFRGDVSLVPDLSYVGAVARDYSIDLTADCIDAFVISHSKPFGGYYHRCGGVFARDLRRSLFGNVWFKNLTSLAWGSEMMHSHGVYDLPRRYRPYQEAATAQVAAQLGIEHLTPADIMIIATAPMASADTPLLRTLIRGGGGDNHLRVCVTPMMSTLIDPELSSTMNRIMAGTL